MPAGGRSLFIIHYDITIYLILQCILLKYEVAIGPVTGHTLYSYRSGCHVLSIFLLALILLVRVRNEVWFSVRLGLGLGIGFGLAPVRNSVRLALALGIGFGLESIALSPSCLY